jgi:uncharacterized protein YukE
MTAAASELDAAQLLADLRSTAEEVRNGNWSSADGSTALDALGETASPLSALASAGLGWAMEFVSFLEEPLNLLLGDPGAISSGAQGFQSAGQDVSSLAGSYQQSAGAQTSEWSGAAASGYRKSGAQLADGIEALSQASTTVSQATSGAGELVAHIRQIVTELITEAVATIIPILTQAVATASATFGASIAAAIPQVVQIAVDYGQRIAGKLRILLSDAQNLMQLVQAALQAVTAVTQVIKQLTKRGADSEATGY